MGLDAFYKVLMVGSLFVCLFVQLVGFYRKNTNDTTWLVWMETHSRVWEGCRCQNY